MGCLDETGLSSKGRRNNCKMGTNNRKKTLKQIKGLDKAHPYSRKATQMKRVIQRNGQLQEKSLDRIASKQLKSRHFSWNFHDFNLEFYV